MSVTIDPETGKRYLVPRGDEYKEKIPLDNDLYLPTWPRLRAVNRAVFHIFRLGGWIYPVLLGLFLTPLTTITVLTVYLLVRPTLLWCSLVVRWIEFGYRGIPDTPVYYTQAADLANEKQAINALHPHGACCWPAYLAPWLPWGTTEFCNSHLGSVMCTAVGEHLAKTPIMYELTQYQRLHGRRQMVCDANQVHEIQKRLDGSDGFDKASVVVVQGGFIAPSDCGGHTEDHPILERKGLVKTAMRHGWHILPLYSFGTQSMYENWMRSFLPANWCLALGRFAQKTGIPISCWWGWMGTSIPLHEKCIVIAGKRLDFSGLDPENADHLNQAHDKYLSAIKELYHAYRQDDRQLCIYDHRTGQGRPDNWRLPPISLVVYVVGAICTAIYTHQSGLLAGG